MTITYAIEDGIGAGEFVDVLKRSGLAERRPVDEADVIRGMVENADLVVTARDGRRTADRRGALRHRLRVLLLFVGPGGG